MTERHSDHGKNLLRMNIGCDRVREGHPAFRRIVPTSSVAPASVFMIVPYFCKLRSNRSRRASVSLYPPRCKVDPHHFRKAGLPGTVQRNFGSAKIEFQRRNDALCPFQNASSRLASSISAGLGARAVLDSGMAKLTPLLRETLQGMPITQEQEIRVLYDTRLRAMLRPSVALPSRGGRYAGGNVHA